MSFVSTINLNNLDYKNINTHCQQVIPSVEQDTIKKILANEVDVNQVNLDLDIKRLINEYKTIELESEIENDSALEKIRKQIFEKANLYGNIQLNKIDYWNNPYVYGDEKFWKKSFDYNNTFKNGEVIQYKGVCNSMLLDNCDRIKIEDKQNMIGVCVHNQFKTNNTYYTHTSKNPSQSYKTFKPSPASFSYKLPDDSIIPEGVSPEIFSKKYCQGGLYSQIDNTFVCSTF